MKKISTGTFVGALVLLAGICFHGGAEATDITNKLGNDDGAVFVVTDSSGNPILTIEADATSPNIIAGYGGNNVTGGVGGVVIGGGGVSGSQKHCWGSIWHCCRRNRKHGNRNGRLLGRRNV